MALNEWSKNEPIYIDEKAPETDISENFKMQSWEKYIDLPSMLPDQRAWKLESEKQGVLRVAFSNKGRYLAMACTMKESQTIIKIADMESGKIVLDGPAKDLADNEDVKEFYLGGGDERRSFKNLKSFKRRKRWI